MNARLDELIQHCLEDRATREEIAALQEALKENAGLRALYLDYINLDLALCAVADAAAVEEETAHEIPVARPSRFQWWQAAAVAACLALAVSAGLLTHPWHSPARPELTAAIESTQQAIAKMPMPPTSPLPAWMSPTASLLAQPDIPQ